MIDATIETAPMTSGNSTTEMWSGKVRTPRSITATAVTAYVSNRSAAMPAQSPTLSPTLSAITAGLRGSSSGMPASTLPARSAPSSAALVKVPPPSGANTEISEPPHAAQVGLRALLHRGRDLLHALVAGRLAEQPAGGEDPVEECRPGANERDYHATVG